RYPPGAGISFRPGQPGSSALARGPTAHGSLIPIRKRHAARRGREPLATPRVHTLERSYFVGTRRLMEAFGLERRTSLVLIPPIAAVLIVVAGTIARVGAGPLGTPALQILPFTAAAGAGVAAGPALVSSVVEAGASVSEGAGVGAGAVQVQRTGVG